MEEPVREKEQCGARERDDARGEAVETVDEVDRVRHEHDPQHRDDRGDVGRQHDDVRVEHVERHAEEEHRDARDREQARGEHLAGELRRRGDIDDVVERTDEEHRARAEEQARGFGVVLEHAAELRHV